MKDRPFWTTASTAWPGNNSTTADCTLENCMKVLRDFEERFPASTRAVRIRANRETMESIVAGLEDICELDNFGLAPLSTGLPLIVDEEVRHGYYVTDMADGSEKWKRLVRPT